MVGNHLDVYLSSSHCSPVSLSLQEEVEKVVSLLQEQARSLSRHGLKKHLRVLPMYSGLPYADQLKVFERVPHSVRKVNLTHSTTFDKKCGCFKFPHSLPVSLCSSQSLRPSV